MGWIVFRSFRDGGGIYLVPVSGGVERKITSGFSPRFSPDGRWIVYSAIEESGNGSIYVIPVTGGTPRRIGTNTTNAGFPLWTPDGARIIYTDALRGDDYEWWIADVPGKDGGSVG